jgi:HK97 family phage prohead protease
MTDLTLHFSADVTAADTQRRTIVGTVAPYGAVGNTSIGPVAFLPGSLRASDDVKLLLEHDGRRPIGRATSFQESNLGLLGTFRVAQTTAGTDALVEASEGLRGGLSVGARILEHTVDSAGTMQVSAAELIEVSLVTSPAFAEAQVSHVAASAPEDDEPTESPEEDIVENETTEVAAAEVAASPAPVIEAARPSMPYITAQPRDVKGLTAGAMLRHQLRARFGDLDSQDVVTHVTAAIAKQDTVRDAGVIPVPLLREIIALVDANRPFIESIDRQPLIAEGMSFRIPRVTTSAAVGYQGAELTEVVSTQGQIQDITVPVRTFAGANLVSRQLIDRSDPSYFEELLRQLAQSYAHGTDKRAYDEVKGNNASTPAGTANVGSLYAAVVKGISDAYGVMRFTPNRILVAPGGTSGTSWVDFLGARDTAGRPLFAAAAPQNAAGLITQGSTNGTVAGLEMVVDPHIGANEKAHVYPSAFATFYETPGAPFQVQVTDVANLGVEVGVYGYFATAAKFPTAIRQLNIYAG